MGLGRGLGGGCVAELMYSGRCMNGLTRLGQSCDQPWSGGRPRNQGNQGAESALAITASTCGHGEAWRRESREVMAQAA